MLFDSYKTEKKTNRCFIVIPGFNQNPEALMPLIEILLQNGYDVFLWSYGQISETDSEFFLKNLISFLNSLEKKYFEINGLGYSFGGMWIKVLSEFISFKKNIFFAPAFYLKPRSWFLSYFLFLYKKIPSIPLGDNELEKKYRKHLGGVPSTEYKFLFSALRKYKPQIESSAKTVYQMFIAAQDELIDFERLKAWHSKQNKMGSFFEVSKEGAKLAYKHLIFDEITLSKSQFLEVKSQINKFIA